MDNYEGRYSLGKYRIVKQFKFEAAHSLENLPPMHKCSKNHGHGYLVQVIAESHELDERGFIVDYGEFDPFKELLEGSFDHQDLNEVVPFQTSAENLARYFFDWCNRIWPQVIGVRVSETQSTWAEFWA